MRRLVTLLLALATHPGLHCNPLTFPTGEVYQILADLQNRDPGGDITL